MSETGNGKPDDPAGAIEQARVLQFPNAARQASAAGSARPGSLPPEQAGASPSGGDTSGPPPDGPPGGGQDPGAADGGGGDNGGPIDQIEKMNLEWAYVLHGSRGLILREREDVEPEERVRFISVDAFRTYCANRPIRWQYEAKDDDGKPVQKWASRDRGKYWLNHSLRRTYDGVCFFPNPDGARAPKRYLNLWRGYGLAPSTAAAGRADRYAIFSDHLANNIAAGDAAHARWIWHWFAHTLQRPRERIGTAIVLRGKMGAGKTIAGEVIGRLIPSHYFLVDDSRYLTGQFNAHMASCLLLQVDEGFWAGDKSAEGRLKGLITARKQMIESKGVDPVRLDNYVRVMFSSNENWVVPAGLEERRFAVFDVADHAMQNDSYFGELFRQLEDGGYAALLADLLAVDLDAEDAPNLRRIPKTGALLEQKIRSMDPVFQWFYERLEDGAPTRRASSWKDDVAIITLHNDYLKFCDRIGQRRRVSETEFGIAMRRLLPFVRKVRKTFEVPAPHGAPDDVHVRRVWGYELPDLQACRDHLEGLMGQPVAWPPVDGDSLENRAESPAPDWDDG